MRIYRWTFISITFAFILSGVGLFLVGSNLSKPAQSSVTVPSDLHAESIVLPSNSGTELKGSWLQGKLEMPGILLMHGIRADRRALFARAQHLNNLGYSVFMFDFQAHGESQGSGITFGYLESKDAHSAVSYMRSRIPGKKIGAIGISLGGAASLLGTQPLTVDALVLESVYPDIRTAIYNRLHMRVGFISTILTPLFLAQVEYRMGISLKALSPAEHIGNVRCPLLILSGSDDLHTTLKDTERLFAAAREPKELEIFSGARHVDLMKYDPKKYNALISKFFAENLRD